MNQNQIFGLAFGFIVICIFAYILFSKKKKGTVPNLEKISSNSIEQINQNRESLFKDRLLKSQSSLSATFKQLFSLADISKNAWTELEDQLIQADVGANAAITIVQKLQQATKAVKTNNPDVLRNAAKTELIKIVQGQFNRTLNTTGENNNPAVILIVGVNGTGKTTTSAKIAKVLVNQGHKVLLGAADTFRAAAVQQLATWGERIKVPVIRGNEGSDPASVAFETVQAGISQDMDVVVIDTAGRLHTKQGLMDELGKVQRVVTKVTKVSEILLVIDATTGQNGLTQAKVFAEVVPVTGIVLSKLDGTAKGGIVIGVQEALGVPVKFVGLGEGPDDIAQFDPISFVEGLIN